MIDYSNHPIIISSVKNVNDNKPLLEKCTWAELRDTSRKATPRGKLKLAGYLEAEKSVKDAQKDGLGFVPGEFTKAGTRSKADLKARYLLVLDLDDGFYTFEQLVRALQGFECVVHTSYSHSENKGKYRVFVLFDNPVTEDIEGTCSRMLDYFVSILGKHIDDKCWTVNQLYFTPSCPPDAIGLYRFQHITGEPLRVKDFQAPAPDKEQIKAARQATGTRPGDDYNRRGSWRELLEGEGWHHYFDGKGGSYWTRPGKNRGISGAVFPDSNVFYCHTSATEAFPFEAGKAYNLFHAYVLINHGGDYTAAARQLATEGYGDRQSEKGQQEDTGDSKENAPPKSFDLSRLVKGKELRAGDYSVTFVVDKLIPENSIILFYAKGGSGKSTLATQIGAAVESGNRFMGLNTLKRPVVVIDYENPVAVLHDRIKGSDGADDIYFWTGSKNPPQINKAGWTELKDLITTLGNPLIFIDTLSSSCSGLDILNNGDFSPVMQKIVELRNMGATIVLLHHTPKQDETKYIGASCIYNQVDHVLAMYPVRTPGQDKEVVDEDEAKVYRFGTKDKTRFGHFTMHVEFDDDRGGFVIAEDPDKDILDRLHKLIHDHPGINQTGVINQIGATVTKEKLKRLLKQNEGRLWTVTHGVKNAKLYTAISVFQFSDPIGANNTTTENDRFDDSEKQDKPYTKQSTTDGEFASYSVPFEKHKKQDDNEPMPVFDF